MLQKLLIIILLVSFLGVSGCENRLKFVYYEYNLTSCPSDNFVWQNQASHMTWFLSKKEPSYDCRDFSSYLIQDEEFRKTKEQGHSRNINITIVRQETCRARVLFSYDYIATDIKTINPTLFSKVAIQALLPENQPINNPPSEEVIGNIEDFKKWCSRKD